MAWEQLIAIQYSGLESAFETIIACLLRFMTTGIEPLLSTRMALTIRALWDGMITIGDIANERRPAAGPLLVFRRLAPRGYPASVGGGSAVT